ncbi:Fanconi anemia group I protein homolog isoform X2 [Oscarella lobularis]|uniref:Fanconi anemia group I protein homolog isoform X2 n=1 Tax=Oscarella lobularis TaxID=121494 RepID=UPI0033138A6B
MDVSLVRLYESKKTAELRQATSRVSIDDIEKRLRRRVLHDSGDPAAFLRAIFEGSPRDLPDSLIRCIAVFRYVSELLDTEEIHPKIASNLAAILTEEVDSLPSSSLVKLARFFTEGIKTGKCKRSLELFAKILNNLSQVPTVQDDCLECSGQEYKCRLLDIVCNLDWSSTAGIHLATMFRDVSLSTDELKAIIVKALQMLKEVDINEVSPLVYQLLLLSSKGHKILVFEGISAFFVAMDSQARSEMASDVDVSALSVDQLRHAEGNCILHVVFAIKQDQDRGREFIKYLKTCQQQSCDAALAPFTFTLALAIAKIQHFEEPIFDCLKAAVTTCFKDKDKYRTSKWIQENFFPPKDIEALLLEAVQNSRFGWDYVSQGLIQFGFLLMDSFNAKPTAERAISSLRSSASERACSLGSKLLLETFKTQDIVRGDILELAMNRIISGAAHSVKPFLDLLASLVESAPQFLLGSISKIRETFDHLALLPVHTARAFLKAIEPLLKFSTNLRDSLMLVLRKSLFARQSDARKIAVMGYLIILEKFKLIGSAPPSSQLSQYSASLSLSQVAADVHQTSNSAGNETLCLEVLGILRRCFTHQSDVRKVFYAGIDSVAKVNSQLGPAVLQLLLQHFRRYYEPNEDVPLPLKLASCVSKDGKELKFIEPLAQLLSCFLTCLVQYFQENDSDEGDEEGTFGDANVDACRKVVVSLTKRLMKCELEDLGLDKTSDFSPASETGATNLFFGHQLLGIYEALLEFSFVSGDFSVQSSETMLQLFCRYQTLAATLKAKPPGGGKKGRPTAAPKTLPAPSTLLSLNSVAALLNALFCDRLPSHHQSLSLLRESAPFVIHIMGAAASSIKQIRSTGFPEEASSLGSRSIFKQCCLLGRSLCNFLTDPDEIVSELREKEKSLSLLALEGYCDLVSAICIHFPRQLEDFLTASAVSDAPDFQQKIIRLIRNFQKIILGFVRGGDEGGRHGKEVQLMVNLVGTLADKLEKEGRELAQVQAWFQKFCTEFTLDSSLVKVVLNLLLSTTHQEKSGTSVVRKVAQDIHSQLGDIDEDVDVEDRTHLSLVTPSAAPTIALAVITYLDGVVNEVDWALGKLKSLLKSKDELEDKRETMESAVCIRLGGIVVSLHEMTQSALPLGPCTESLLKILTKVYASLGSTTKYCLMLYTQHVSELPTQFEKLVKLSATHLQPQVYGLITYIQAAESRDPDSHKGKNKKMKAPQRGRVMRETRIIPNLIYSVEQYEKFLIQLSSKSKTNLMEHFKRSTARDFRINTTTLEQALNQQEQELDLDENQDTTRGDDAATQPSSVPQARGRKKQRDRAQTTASKRHKASQSPSF